MNEKSKIAQGFLICIFTTCFCSLLGVESQFETWVEFCCILTLFISVLVGLSFIYLCWMIYRREDETEEFKKSAENIIDLVAMFFISFILSICVCVVL